MWSAWEVVLAVVLDAVVHLSACGLVGAVDLALNSLPVGCQLHLLGALKPSQLALAVQAEQQQLSITPTAMEATGADLLLLEALLLAFQAMEAALVAPLAVPLVVLCRITVQQHKEFLARMALPPLLLAVAAAQVHEPHLVQGVEAEVAELAMAMDLQSAAMAAKDLPKPKIPAILFKV